MSTFSVCYPLLMCVGGRSFYTSVNLDQVFSIGGFQIHRAAASLQIQDEIHGYFIRMLVRLAVGEATNNIVEI